MPIPFEEVKRSAVEMKCYDLLWVLGINLDDRNFKETPARLAKLLLYWTNPPELDLKTFKEPHDEMILVRNHEVWGLCPHHMLPVKMLISAAYIPTTHVLGLSKIPRVIDHFARRITLQETAADSIATTLYELVEGSVGAACYIQAEHTCMKARGVRSSGDVITSCVRGVFAEKLECRNEFLSFIRR